VRPLGWWTKTTVRQVLTCPVFLFSQVRTCPTVKAESVPRGLFPPDRSTARTASVTLFASRFASSPMLRPLAASRTPGTVFAP